MRLSNMTYNPWHDTIEEQFVVPRRIKENEETFGERLVRLRQTAGYSQRELAKEIGTSNRMLVHYEKHAGQPTAPLLPKLANALGVSTDQLLGVEKVKHNGRLRDTKLWRRFNQIETLPPTDRKPIVQIIDTFLQGKKAERQIRKLVADQG